MSRPNLTVRSRQPEMMDNPNVRPAELDHAMHHLQVINRLLNGYGPSLAGIAKLLPNGQPEFSLLDVGCGSGDTLREIALWARRKNLKAQLTGIELSERSAERAAAACAAFPEIQIMHQDLFEMPPDTSYDIVHCALVLHHFSEDADASHALLEMGKRARLGIVINDLNRHYLAWHSIRLLTRTFSRSAILQNDAPLSVARAFTRRDLMDLAEQAGLKGVNIEWHWAFRWLMTAQRYA